MLAKFIVKFACQGQAELFSLFFYLTVEVPALHQPFLGPGRLFPCIKVVPNGRCHAVK